MHLKEELLEELPGILNWALEGAYRLIANNYKFTTSTAIKKVQDKYNASEKGSFIERDLHPLLVKFLYSNPHFKCYAKTIYHETSTKKTKGYNQWLHPDIVGIYFPFKDYQG